MASIDIDEGFCTMFTRHEWMLFLNICSRIDPNKEALISMKELENATQWHYQKIIANTERLAQMGLIESVSRDDVSGDNKDFYKVLASNVAYKPGEVPKNGFSPRMPPKHPRKPKTESNPAPVVVKVQKRKRIVKGMFDRVSFPL